jgi:hypothetical protein
VLSSDQKLTLGLLATITPEIDPFRAYAPFLVHLLFFNVSWKSWSVKLLSTACDSVSIISVLSEWRFYNFIFNTGNRNNLNSWGTTVISWSNIPWFKIKRRTVHCRNATSSSFIAKVLGEVFTHLLIVAVKCHSNMPRNLMFWETPRLQPAALSTNLSRLTLQA